MADELRLELLGGLRLTEDGSPLSGLASHKGQALLAYLAVTHKPHSRDGLAGLLWGEFSQEEARTSLRAVLSQLRKVAAPHLTITRDTVAFNFDTPYQLDIEAFVANLRSDAQSAMNLYQGEFLEGFYVLQAQEFEEWAVGQRQWLHGLAVEALHRLASQAARDHDISTAISYLGRLLILEPWREEAHRELMRLLAETGQRSAALAQYVICRRILLSELGVEPSTDTSLLYEQILSGEVTAKPTLALQEVSEEEAKTQSGLDVPHNLPASVTLLLGRDVELSQLSDRLQRPGLRLMTLVGTGGIGKTRLALELASRSLRDFPGGVFFVPLASLSPASTYAQSDLVPMTIAQALGLQEGPGDSLLDGLKQWLSERQALLVLDNFEHLLDASETVSVLLEASPGLKVLVTSREPLGLYGEHQYPVMPLAVPDPKNLPILASLQEYPSLALFCARAEAVRPGFELTEANKRSVVEICRRLDGSPLAIELAATQVKGLSVAEIARRLDDRFRLLKVGSRNLPDRHQTMRASLDWSYDLLSTGNKELLSRLSIFSGGWGMEAAEAVCAGGGLPTDEIMDGVLRLVDKSLVMADPETERYGMHETIRQYAREKLETAGEVDALEKAHTLYFMRLAEEAEPLLLGAQQLAWLTRLEADHDNIRSALNWCLRTRSVDVGLRLAGAIFRFWNVRGYISEGREYLSKVLALLSKEREHASAATALSHPDLRRYEALVINGVGTLAYTQGDFATAGAMYEQSLVIRQELGDKEGTARALNNLGNVGHAEGDYDAARELYFKSMAIYREIGHTQGLSGTLSNLGNEAYAQGDYRDARALYQEALTLFRQLGNGRLIANALSNLGNTAYAEGDYDTADEFYREATDIRMEVGDKKTLVTSLGQLGAAAYAKGDYTAARAFYEEGLALNSEVGDTASRAYILGQVAVAECAQGEYITALTLHEESLRLYKESGNKTGIALTLGAIGHVRYCQGNYPAAYSLCLEGLAIIAPSRARNAIASLLGRLGAVCVEMGEREAEKGVRLLGSVDAMLQSMGGAREPEDLESYNRAVVSARVRLGEATFKRAWEEGLTMSMEQTIEYAMQQTFVETHESER